MKILNYVVTTLAALLICVSAQAQQYSKITYVHSDPDGTAFAATDEQGNVEWKIEHFPFGREFENTSQDRKSDISFAGKPYDEEIGLSYFGGRWYDPDAGRFTGIDPMPVQANDYETFNRYSYAFNNPYKYVDPDGNFAFLIPIAIFLAKEIAAEAASRATGGVTDFLSVRRSGTKLIKGGISLLNKQKKDSLCFVEGTPVHTENGLKPIESIVIGDLVLSKNDVTGKPNYKTVTQTFINDDKEILDVEFENKSQQTETFGITKEHPVWLVGHGWVEAGGLKVGDKVDSLSGQESHVKEIKQRPVTERTYNIEVEDYHTYFVGDSGLWVHNMCVGGEAPKSERVRHFTNNKGAQGIKDSNTIKASDQNSVFTVKAKGKPGSPRDVEQQLGISRGKGNNIVEFDANPNEFSVIKNSSTGATERVFKGDVNLTNRKPKFKKNR